MLTVKDFIRQTLEQITDAAREFQEREGTEGATVFPEKVKFALKESWGAQNLTFIGGGQNEVVYATIVDFDLAVTVEENEATSGRGGLSVMSVVKAEGDVSSSFSNSSVSRVRFKFPLQIKRRAQS